MTYSVKEESRKDGIPVNLYLFEGDLDASLGFDAGTLGPFAFTNAEQSITRDSITYEPWPITHSDVVLTTGQDRRNITVDLAKGTELDALFNAYPPSQPVRLVIFRGHADDSPTEANFPVEWTGTIAGVNYPENAIQFTCEPTASAMQRPGLNRNYQLACPYALYSAPCGADRAARIITRTASAVSGTVISLGAPITTPRGVGGFKGGTVEWTRVGGLREIVTIASVAGDGLSITVRGLLRGLTASMGITIVPGCNRTMDHCAAIHSNIQNFGGQPFIPLENPNASTSSIFY